MRVRLLGEDLIAFRDTNGKVGLVDAFCPHRRAPMFFGRNEECGLRCVYHGWKFDRNGTCVDMPSEPPDSLFKTKVTIKAYPTCEGGGVIWTYMGPPELQPPPPDYEWLRAPATHRCVSKTFEHANYLQALEGGLDTAHSSFAHNEKLGDMNWVRNRDGAPRLDVETHRLRLQLRLDAQPRRRRHVRARLSLRDAGAADARRGHVVDRHRQGRRAAARRAHLGADRRRAHVGLQHDLELRRKRADHARVVCRRTKRAGAAAPTT